MPGLIKTIDLKNKLEGDELDLSMMRLTEIPVDEIAAFPKATKIDLSNNELTEIPDNFAALLTHITKVELGSNKIKELPSNFGILNNLKHLDLYNNQLTDLPCTLANLRNLRYLDLKGNFLTAPLAKVAGNCLNSKECQDAAKNVVNYLRKQNHLKDKQEAYKLKQEKEKEMERMKREEEELVRKRAEKKAAKEKKRLEMQKVREAAATAMQNNRNGNIVQNGKNQKKNNQEKKPKESKEINKKALKRWSCLGYMNIFLLFALLIVGGACLVVYTEGDFSLDGLKATWPKVKSNSYLLFNKTKEGLKKENIKSMMTDSWTILKSILSQICEVSVICFHSLKQFIVEGYSSLKSGEYAEYFLWIEPVWESFVQFSSLVIAKVTELLDRIDWDSIILGIKYVINFVANQFYVLKEELDRNEAITTIWKNLAPFRSSVWHTCIAIWETCCNVSQEVYVNYFPIIKNQSIYMFNNIKSSIDNLLE